MHRTQSRQGRVKRFSVQSEKLKEEPVSVRWMMEAASHCFHSVLWEIINLVPPNDPPIGGNLVSCAAATTAATIALIPSASRDLSSRPPLGRVVSNSTAVTPELIFSSHNVVSVNDLTAGCLPADNREAVCCWWWWVVSVFPRPPGKHCFDVTHSQASWQGELANTKPHSGYSLIDTL